MSKTTLVTWDLQPHTSAKHDILCNYLKAWMPIMTSGFNTNRKAIFVDGFAGPGEYSKGEEGSPIIALKMAIDYSKKFPTKSPKLRFVFIEEDIDRFNNLRRKIAELFSEENIENLTGFYKPIGYESFGILLRNGSFEGEMDYILSKLNGKMAPVFAFIDPFGFKTMPFKIIKRLLNNNTVEVFINFMYEDINRFLKVPTLQATYDRLFGTKEWKNILNNLESYSAIDRRYLLHALYKEQLEKAGLKYIISFEMKNQKNSTEYFLYYGTNHIKGLEKMKDAMWKVDGTGAFTFSDYKFNQKQMELNFTEFDNPNFQYLANQIFNKFKGTKAPSTVVKDFVVTDTIYRRSSHSTEGLKILEKDGRIIDVENRAKKMAYPDNSIIIFRN